jgi:predicted RNA-binding protein with PUA-like domain
MNYWLLKSEPFKYSWQQMLADKETFWDGVRNYTARINLRAMKKGDLAFFYHSNEGLEIVGIIKISKEAYQDPTTPDPAWVAVDVKPFKTMKKPVSLATMKAEDALQNMQLLRIARLSVCAVTEEEFKHICSLGETKI